MTNRIDIAIEKVQQEEDILNNLVDILKAARKAEYEEQLSSRNMSEKIEQMNKDFYSLETILRKEVSSRDDRLVQHALRKFCDYSDTTADKINEVILYGESGSKELRMIQDYIMSLSEAEYPIYRKPAYS